MQQHQPIVNNSLYSLDNSHPLTSEQQHASLPTRSSDSQQPSSTIPTKYANFTGFVTITAEQHTIRLCHNDEVFNLQANTPLFNQLKRLDRQSAYVEFEGQINQSRHPNHLRAVVGIKQLHYLSANESQSCNVTTKAVNFAVVGAEKTWMGYGRDNQFSFIIKDLSSHWEIKKSVITKGISAFIETQNSSGEQLNISFTGKDCVDNNSNYWQYETTIFVKDRLVKGCGKYLNQHQDNRAWLGHYRYKNKNVTMDVKLNKHHQAGVTYHYNNGKIQRSSGYWHVYGSSGLKLLLTQHQGYKANVVYHFQRNGLRLQASQQWRDNQKYSFNGALLTLDRMTDEIETQSFITAPTPRSREFKAVNIASPTVSRPAINHAIKRYFSMHKSNTDKVKYWFSEYDLNGNGQKDLLVMLDWCEDDGCVLLVFENKLNHYKFISRITQVKSPLQIGTTQQHQWQSLLIKDKQQWLQLDFDGISYPSTVKGSKRASAPHFTQVKLFTTSLTADNAIAIK